MEQPTRISFDGVEHPWQLPDIASKLKERTRYTDPKYHKQIYEEMVFADLLKKNPDFLVDDDLRVEDELNSSVDDLIDQTYAKRMLGRPLNKGEHAPDDYKYEWMAERIGFLSGAERTRERLRGLADSLYDSKTIAENKSWDDARKAYGANPAQQSTQPQITSPSRSSMLKATGAEIDPNYPLFLQVADTNTQWSKDHPLRKRFLKEGPSIYSSNRFSKNLDILDRINGPIDEDTYIPRYIKEEIERNPSAGEKLLRELTRKSYSQLENEGKLDEE